MHTYHPLKPAKRFSHVVTEHGLTKPSRSPHSARRGHRPPRLDPPHTDLGIELRKRANDHPFGEELAPRSYGINPDETKGWIGERYDAGAGLLYLIARYYDPKLGMFIQPDWYEVTAPGVGTNRYSYSANDPVNLMDPSGNLFDEAMANSLEQKAIAASRTAASIASTAMLAVTLALTPTRAADGTLGAAITTVQRDAGWHIDGNGRVRDGDGNLVKDPYTGAHIRDGSFRDSVKALERNSRDGQVHHVAEITSQSVEAVDVRSQLDSFATNPNDPSLGVSLSNHRGRHVSGYSRAVRNRILGLNTRREVLAELRTIRDELKDLDDKISREKDEGEREQGNTVAEWTRENE